MSIDIYSESELIKKDFGGNFVQCQSPKHKPQLS